MRSTTLSRLLLSFALLSILLALPSAADKRRSVRSGRSNSVADLKGRVLDTVTSAPVAFAEVRGGGKSVYTEADGRFVLKNLRALETIVITVERSGYATATASAQAGSQQGDVTVRLVPTPTVRVRTTDNATYDIDFESLQFGYVLTFGGYASSSSAELCRTDDSTHITVARAEIKRIIGPATKISQPTCCAGDELMKVRLELKGGGTFDAVFQDSCYGYRIDLIGREHVPGTFQYIPLTQVAEVVMP